jgi:hypothetical protein
MSEITFGQQCLQGWVSAQSRQQALVIVWVQRQQHLTTRLLTKHDMTWSQAGSCDALWLHLPTVVDDQLSAMSAIIVARASLDRCAGRYACLTCCYLMSAATEQATFSIMISLMVFVASAHVLHYPFVMLVSRVPAANKVWVGLADWW